MCESHSVVSDSLQPHRLYSPWNSPGQNTGVGSIPFSRGSSQPTDQTQVSFIAGGFFTSLATRETQEYWDGWSVPSPGDFPSPEIEEPRSSKSQVDSLLSEPPGKPKNLKWVSFPAPGDLPDLGIEPRSPAVKAASFLSEPPGKLGD